MKHATKLPKRKPVYWIEEDYSQRQHRRFFRVLANFDQQNTRIVVGDYFSRADAFRALYDARGYV